MEFDVNKIKSSNRARQVKVTDEEILEALSSGLFNSQAAIARYFGISPQGLGQRIKRLKEKGFISERVKQPTQSISSATGYDEKEIRDLYYARVNSWGYRADEAAAEIISNYHITSEELERILGK